MSFTQDNYTAVEGGVVTVCIVVVSGIVMADTQVEISTETAGSGSGICKFK